MGLPEGKTFWIGKVSETESQGMPHSHFHNYYEIYYLVDGKRRFFVNHSLYDVLPDDIMLINKGDIHQTMTAKDDKRHVRYLITFSDQFLDGLGEEFDKNFLLSIFNNKKAHLHESARHSFHTLLHKIESKINQDDIHSQYIAKLCIIELLVHINKLVDKNASPLLDNLTAYEDRIQNACRYICNYYNQPISLNQMAKIAYMSPTYFSKKFKRVTGIGFNEYLNNVRVKMAANMLVETKDSITEIATYCGYQDSNYFGDVFKKIIGVSPNKYRKEHFVV